MDSLRERYDAFYEEQPKVHFTKCELGYIKSSEGPMDIFPYGSNGNNVEEEKYADYSPPSFRYEGQYSLWT